MDTLDGIKTVIAVFETGSFTAAGERLGLSKALVSKYVGQIEEQFGVRLFNRSTRRLVPTEAGLSYYQQAQSVLDEFSALVDQVSGNRKKPQGRIKVSTSVTFGEHLLAPKLPLFIRQYPDVELEIQLTNRRIDLLEEGVDIAIRVSRKENETDNTTSIVDFDFILCASPTFVQQNGQPLQPSDLMHLPCILDSNFQSGQYWPFTNTNGVQEQVEIPRHLAVNSPRVIRQLALDGIGIALLPEFFVRQDIHDQKLIPLLSDYQTMSFTLQVLLPQRAYIPQKVRCFTEFLQQNFSPICDSE